MGWGPGRPPCRVVGDGASPPPHPSPKCLFPNQNNKSGGWVWGTDDLKGGGWGKGGPQEDWVGEGGWGHRARGSMRVTEGRRREGAPTAEGQ